jgi:membrane-associated phospholipid phosphatase
MQSINLMLFRSFGAGFDPNAGLMQIALTTSGLASWLIVVVVAYTTLRRRGTRSDAVVILLGAGLIGMLSHSLAAWFDTPRPFMMELSPDYALHSGRGGFPSTHASVMFTVAAYMAWQPRMRAAAAIIAFLALATGLARVYLGVHFPLDVLGGLGLGMVTGSALAALHKSVRPRCSAWPDR